MLFFAQAAATPDYWPFGVLLISVALIIFLITVLRVHAFLALTLAAVTAGLLSTSLPGEPSRAHWVQAVELTAAAFGTTAGNIGIVIALASMIGLCLMESGAADKVVRRFLAVFGEHRAGTALLVSGYILSIPIFFDTFFMLLLPLAVALAARTGKHYLLYIMAICCSGVVTHSLVIPHPGPLAMAESLKIDLGLTIMAGIIAGILPVGAAWLVVQWIARRMEVPLRESGGRSLSDLRSAMDKPESELPSFTMSILPVILPIILISAASTFIAIQGKPFDTRDVKDSRALAATLREDGRPVSLFLRAGLADKTRADLAALPAGAEPSPALQNAMLGDLNRIIRTNTQWFAEVTARPETTALRDTQPQAENLVRLNRMLVEDALPGVFTPRTGMNPILFSWTNFLGNRNVALFIGTLLAIVTLVRQRGLSLASVGSLMEGPFATAGVIILITSAGGAFGLMLRTAGVGDAVKAAVAGKEVNLIFLSWLVAAVIRVAQGSATVAMLTTAAMIYPIMTTTVLPYHPIYLFLAIGFGAMTLSWMNDSGFWVVCKLSGMTEKETLKSWTVIVTVASLAGLIECLVFSKLLPMTVQ